VLEFYAGWAAGFSVEMYGVRSCAKNGMVRECSQRLVDAILDGYDTRALLAEHAKGAAVMCVRELE